MSEKPPGALVIDFAPVAELDRSLDRVAEAWSAVPAPMRSRLTRLVWLHPDGELVIYRAPDGPPPKEG